MRGNNFIFNYVLGMHYVCNKTDISRGGSYMNSAKLFKDKKVTINPKNNNDNCFQYVITVANQKKKKKKNLQIITNICHFKSV